MPANQDRPPQPEISDHEMGTPIAELADLRVKPGRGFVGRIRGSIERRRLGSDLTDLGWNGMLAIVIQFLDFVLQILNGSETEKKRR